MRSSSLRNSMRCSIAGLPEMVSLNCVEHGPGRGGGRHGQVKLPPQAPAPFLHSGWVSHDPRGFTQTVPQRSIVGNAKLPEQPAGGPRTVGERFAALETENAELRKQLLAVQRHLRLAPDAATATAVQQPVLDSANRSRTG
jgi:hypothetical protein